MPSPAPAIVLVAPQMGENIGAAARAMLNFGLTDLRIVAPRDGWPNAAAAANASGALEIITPRIFATLAEALAGLQLVYATTARPRDVNKPVLTPREAVTESRASGAAAGFVFGRERTGLENDDISLCHAIVTAPVNPAFSSLNISQAVLMMAYEWMTASAPDMHGTQDTHIPARHEEMVNLFARLEAALDDAQFFKTEGNRPVMIRNIRAALMRAEMTNQEVRTFQGIVSALREKR